MRDLVVAAGPVDLLSSAAAADSSIYAVTKKSDSSPTSAGTPAGPSTAVASGSPPSASGQTVTVGNKGVTYVAGPVPEIKSISPVPQTPGFATPGAGPPQSVSPRSDAIAIALKDCPQWLRIPVAGYAGIAVVQCRSTYAIACFLALLGTHASLSQRPRSDSMGS